MVSKTARILAFFILLGLIAPSGVLAQETPWMTTVFTNASDIPDEPNRDIEFNGITIIFVGKYVFMPQSRTKPLDFKEEFTVENISKNQKDFKDKLKDGISDMGAFEDYVLDENITFKEYPDRIDKSIFRSSFLKRYPFMRVELNPVEIEDLRVENINLTGEIRVHATIFKNGFCFISLVFPIVTEELRDKYKLKGDFLVADKPLEPDDVISIIRLGNSKKNIRLKEGEATLYDMLNIRKVYLERIFFGDKQTKNFYWRNAYIIHSWNINKTLKNLVELVEENPWEICGILTATHMKYRQFKHFTFSDISEVFASPNNYFFGIFGEGSYFEHTKMPKKEEIDEWGYAPYDIRLVEVVFLQECMLELYNDYISKAYEEGLREKEESKFTKEFKEVARFRSEIIIALYEFYMIEDSLRFSGAREFVRYGKQKSNLDLLDEILRVNIEDFSEISREINNAIMQQNNEYIQNNIMKLQKRMEALTWVLIILAILSLCLPTWNIYREKIKPKICRLLERKANK